MVAAILSTPIMPPRFQIYGQTADNTSNNDTMISALETLLPGPAGQHTRIRCMCHILNLVVKVCGVYPLILLRRYSPVKPDMFFRVQAVLRPFSKPRTKKDRQAAGLTIIQREDDDEDEDDTARGSLSEDSGDEDAVDHEEELESDDEDEEDDEDPEYEHDLDQAASDAALLDKLDKAARKRFAITDQDRRDGRTTLSKVCLRRGTYCLRLTDLCS